MSAKRYLLILSVLLAASCAAALDGWHYSTLYHYKGGNGNELTGTEINQAVTYPLPFGFIEAEERFAWTDLAQDDRKERLNNRFQLTGHYLQENLQAKLFYRGEYYNHNEIKGYFSDDTVTFARRTYLQQFGLESGFRHDRFRAYLSFRQRSFFYNPYLFNTNTFEFESAHKIEQTDNVTTEGDVGFRIISPLSVFVTGFSKQSLNRRDDKYDLKSIGSGLQLEESLSAMTHLAFQTRIDWRAAELLSEQRSIPISSEARISHLINPQLAAFLSYHDRAFYDRQAGQLLRNSSAWRTRVKYTLEYDASMGSFAAIGVKYSRRNQSTGYSANTELLTFPRLYLGGGIKYNPDRSLFLTTESVSITSYEGIVRYFLLPTAELCLNYIYTDDGEFKKITRYAAAGIRMTF